MWPEPITTAEIKTELEIVINKMASHLSHPIVLKNMQVSLKRELNGYVLKTFFVLSSLSITNTNLWPMFILNQHMLNELV